MPTLKDILEKVKEAKRAGYKDKDIKVATVKSILQEVLKPTKKQKAQQAVKEAISTTRSTVAGKESTIGRDVIVGAGKGILQLGSFFPGADIGVSPERKKAVTEPTTTAQQVGAFATRDVLPTILGSGLATKGVGALAGFLAKQKAASQITAGATKIAPFFGRAITGTGRTTEFLAKSAATTGVATGVTKGELPTTGELGLGLGIDIFTGGVGKILKEKVAPLIFQLGVKIDAPKFETIDKFARMAPGKFIGTKRGIVQQTDDLIKISGEQLDDLLSPLPMKWERSDLTKGLVIEIKNTFDAGFDTEARAMQKFMDSFLKAGKTKNLTAKDLLKLKRDFAKRVAKVFEAGKVADPTVAARKQAVLQIWKDIDTILNSLSPEVKELNELMSLGYAIGKPLSKELKKGVRINLIDLMGSLRSLPITPAATSGAALSKILGKTLSRKELSPFLKTILARPSERAQ